MSKAVIDHLMSASLKGDSAYPLELLILAGFVVILLAFAGMVFWVLSYRSKVMLLASSAAEQEKTVSTFAAELEAQAFLSRQMSIDLEELRKRCPSHEDASWPDSTGRCFSNGPLNLNRRGQILRLSRKGKSIGEIAQDLNVAQGEVELVLKVHDLSHRASGQEA